MEDIKDKIGAIFEAYSKTAKNKVDKVDKVELPKLLAEEVIKMGFLPFLLYRSCKLLQCAELNERLDCKSIEIKWYKYMRKVYVMKSKGD